MIKLESVTKIFNIGKKNEFKALDNINLTIEDGEFVAIIGKSGAGKTTLLNCVSLADVPTKGKIFIDNKDATNFTDSEKAQARNKDIGLVFQDFFLIDEVSVLDNILVPLYFTKMKKNQRYQKCANVLSKLGIKDKMKNKIYEISGGEKQRVAIARAIINEPKFIIADEPTGALDSNTSFEILNILKKLNENGATIILVTHDLEIAKFAKRIITIADGKIVEERCDEKNAEAINAV